MGIKLGQDLIDVLRGKIGNTINNGDNNVINLISNKNIKAIIINGNNNSVISSSKNINVTINIYGNNNRILIEDNVTLNGDSINIGTPDSPSEYCIVKIGRCTSSNGIFIRLLENNSELNIGESCLFSTGINIFCSDTHSILNSKNGLINQGKKIIIGNRVWCGMDVKIGKNVEISDDTIIGWGSVVTKSFSQTNIIIARNPAKVIKDNVHWDVNRPQFFLNKQEQTELRA